jgi:hypothetical protein
VDWPFAPLLESPPSRESIRDFAAVVPGATWLAAELVAVDFPSKRSLRT